MGYLSTLPDGRIVKVNRTFCAWTGRAADDVLGARFRDLLTVGGKVFHDTHLAPLLRMQGAVREVALDVLRADGSMLPCLVNAVELRDEDGAPCWCGRRCSRRPRGGATSASCWPPSGRPRSRRPGRGSCSRWCPTWRRRRRRRTSRR